MSDVDSEAYLIDTIEAIEEVRKDHGASKPEALAMLQACARSWNNYEWLKPADVNSGGD